MTVLDPSTLVWRKSSRSGPNGGNCVEVALVWRKSSRSGPNGGQCVEVAAVPGRVAVRDSKDPHGPVLAVPAATWQTFLTDLRAGTLDRR